MSEPAQNQVAAALSHDQIERMPLPQRRELARRLLGLDAVDELPSRHERRRQQVLRLVTFACAGLIPWIVYLAISLPRHYEASHWRRTWVGFDVLLLTALAATAYLGWRRRQLVILASFAAGLLLLCDCWFDVSTAAHGDRLFAILTAVLVELPLAAVLLSTTYRLLTIVVSRGVGSIGPRALWLMPVMFESQRGDQLGAQP